MFIRTHGRSPAGGRANDSAVSGVTGLNVIHSDRRVAATWPFWATVAAPSRATTGRTAASVADYIMSEFTCLIAEMEVC